MPDGTWVEDNVAGLYKLFEPYNPSWPIEYSLKATEQEKFKDYFPNQEKHNENIFLLQKCCW